MMQVDYAKVAIVSKHAEAPIIELDAEQPAALCRIDRVIKESGGRKKSAHRGQRAHPAQCSIGIEDHR